jgi:ribosome-binding protein aMBF1 (putative translation factor)
MIMENRKPLTWSEYRKTLNLSPQDEAEIELEKNVIIAIATARAQQGLTQKQLAEKCGLSQSVIARLERSTHSPQMSTVLRVLKPLGYTIAVVPDSPTPGGRL